MRYYVRSFPTVFTKASGELLWDEDSKSYIDFFSGAGALNYGHNNPLLKDKLVEYILSDGVVHGLDMATSAKRDFIDAFERIILRPRNMSYRLQFTGPTGSNAVEAALKLARKVKGRSNIISFTNGFHGVSIGALAATGNEHFRRAAGVSLGDVTFMPFDGYFGANIDTIGYLERMLEDRSSGVDLPAAAIVETIQGEGGVNVASRKWLRDLERCCRNHDMLLIVDEIQVGCGRTGHFFSFEEAGIQPDIITMSKSLSGYGLPLSLVLLRPALDRWHPGEHNGTFRGNNLAFVAGKCALLNFWRDDGLVDTVARKEAVIDQWFREFTGKNPRLGLKMRGRGLIQGLSLATIEGLDVAALRKTRDINLHRNVARRAFGNGLIIETAGADDNVLKVLPSLFIEEKMLRKGLTILEECIKQEIAAASLERTSRQSATSKALPEPMHG